MQRDRDMDHAGRASGIAQGERLAISVAICLPIVFLFVDSWWYHSFAGLNVGTGEWRVIAVSLQGMVAVGYGRVLTPGPQLRRYKTGKAAHAWVNRFEESRKTRMGPGEFVWHYPFVAKYHLGFGISYTRGSKTVTFPYWFLLLSVFLVSNAALKALACRRAARERARESMPKWELSSHKGDHE